MIVRIQGQTGRHTSIQTCIHQTWTRPCLATDQLQHTYIYIHLVVLTADIFIFILHNLSATHHLQVPLLRLLLLLLLLLRLQQLLRRPKTNMIRGGPPPQSLDQVREGSDQAQAFCCCCYCCSTRSRHCCCAQHALAQRGCDTKPPD